MCLRVQLLVEPVIFVPNDVPEFFIGVFGNLSVVDTGFEHRTVSI